MPLNKQAVIRYQVLDQCFANRHKRFYIEDLLEACNKALYEYCGLECGVNKRQLYDDIRFMAGKLKIQQQQDLLAEMWKPYILHSRPFPNEPEIIC